MLVAQQPPPAPQVFQSRTDVVSVDVTVLDRNRHPVGGLTARDFTVLEDGKERPLVAFTPVDLPPRVDSRAAAAWTRDVSPDVTSNAVAEQGRLVVIVFDWSIRFEDQASARRIGRAAIEQLGPNDLAAVVFTSRFSKAGLPQNFTGDRRLLLEAVDQPFAAPLESPLVGIIDPEGLTSGDCYCRLCVADALTSMAVTIRDVPGRRKVMIFIGSIFRGYSTDVCSGQLTQARRQLDEAAGLANLTIDVLDPSGLSGGGSADPGLFLLAQLGGGRTVVHTNAPEASVPEIFNESRSYYLLGFESAVPDTDRRVHSIRVKVNRRGVTVRARDGYVRSPDGATSATATNPLGGVLPRAGIPLRMNVTSVGGTAAATAVVGVRGGLPAQARVPDKLRLTVAANDPYARLVASREDVVNLAEHSPGPTPQFEVFSQLALPPGRYEIRAAVDDLDGHSGSVFAYAEVPDFRAGPFSLSGMMLTTNDTSNEPDSSFGDLLPIVPTVRREFGSSDRVKAFLRVYEPSDRTASAVGMGARILDESGATAWTDRAVLPAAAFVTSHSADYQIDLPVEKLNPGEYLLTVNAEVGTHRLERAVRFRVR
jgi:VWFA-related protein